ncbi:hypothetical protein P7C70_g5252, partial [Phenoliferia sp. Uapishka_3]
MSVALAGQSSRDFHAGSHKLDLNEKLAPVFAQHAAEPVMSAQATAQRFHQTAQTPFRVARAMPAQPGSAYATLPRSSGPSPATSGATTPTRSRRNSLTFRSPARALDIPNPSSRASIYARLTRKASTSHLTSSASSDAAIQQAAWPNTPTPRAGAWRDTSEQAQREGNPQSWAAMMMAATGVDAADLAGGRNAVAASGANATVHSGPGTSGFSSVQRRVSGVLRRAESEVSLGNSFGKRSLVEEPGSYARVEQHILGDEDRNGLMDDEEEATRRLILEDGGKDFVDGGSDSDSDDETPPTRRPTLPNNPSMLSKAIAIVYPPSPLAKNVIKCVLAYAVAELFTFVPALSELVGAPFDVEGPVRNAHVIATVAVYFNPAKTIGAMFEADLFMVIGLCYAAFLCCGSMAMTVLMNDFGHHQLGHIIVLIFWLGGGFGLLAFVKVKVNKPTFTTACSLVSLISSVIITKEGAFHVGGFQSQSILQVVIIVLIGTFVSNVVCFTVWPGSATSKLQVDLNKTLNSFSTLLEMLTKTFLLDEDITTRPESLKKAIDAHQSSFTTLKSSLDQAKYEVLDARIRLTSDAYDDAVASMTRLAQGLTGLRSGLTLQYDLMRAKREGKLEEGKETGALMDELLVFEQFRERVGKSLQQLSWTSKRTLALLRTSFVNTKAGSATLAALQSSDDLEAALSSDALLALKDELEQSLTIFKRSHSQAIKILYQRLPGSLNPSGGAAGEEEGPNDNLFRIYYFCFNLEDWARELSCLVDTFIEIRRTEESVARNHMETRKRWGIFSFVPDNWSLLAKARKGRPNGDKMAKRLTRLLGSRGASDSPFPEIVDGALSSHQIPASQLSFVGRVKQKFWRFGWHMKQSSVLFSIKTGVGVSILASAAFIPMCEAPFTRIKVVRLISVFLSSQPPATLAGVERRVGAHFLYFLNTAHLYQQLVRTYSDPPHSLSKLNVMPAHHQLDAGESTPLLTPEAKEDLEDAVENFMEMELYLQRSLIKLAGLLAATGHEPRLKGPFPVQTYSHVLASCQAILDLMTSMRTVTTREAWYTTVRRDFVVPVNKERREMVGNVLLYLSVLSSAVSLRTPLPAYLPPAAEARDRLVDRLRQLPIVRRRIVRGGSEGLLYLAYALSNKSSNLV